MERSYHSAAEVQATLSELSALKRIATGVSDDGDFDMQHEIFWPLLDALRENPALETQAVWHDLKEMASSAQNGTVRWTAFHAVVARGLEDRVRGEEVKEMLTRTIREDKADFGDVLDFRYEAVKSLFEEIGQKYKDMLPEIYETLAGVLGDSNTMVSYIAGEDLCLAANRCGADPVRTLDIVSPLIRDLEGKHLKEGLRRSIENVVIYQYRRLGDETSRLRDMFRTQAEAADPSTEPETRAAYQHIVETFDHQLY